MVVLQLRQELFTHLAGSFKNEFKRCICTTMPLCTMPTCTMPPCTMHLYHDASLYDASVFDASVYDACVYLEIDRLLRTERL